MRPENLLVGVGLWLASSVFAYNMLTPTNKSYSLSVPIDDDDDDAVLDKILGGIESKEAGYLDEVGQDNVGGEGLETVSNDTKLEESVGPTTSDDEHDSATDTDNNSVEDVDDIDAKENDNLLDDADGVFADEEGEAEEQDVSVAENNDTEGGSTEVITDALETRQADHERSDDKIQVSSDSNNHEPDIQVAGSSDPDPAIQDADDDNASSESKPNRVVQVNYFNFDISPPFRYDSAPIEHGHFNNNDKVIEQDKNIFQANEQDSIKDEDRLSDSSSSDEMPVEGEEDKFETSSLETSASSVTFNDVKVNDDSTSSADVSSTNDDVAGSGDGDNDEGDNSDDYELPQLRTNPESEIDKVFRLIMNPLHS